MATILSDKSVSVPPTHLWCWCWYIDVNILMLMMSMVLLTMMKMASGPHLLTHPTPRREVAGSLKDFLLRPHPLPAAYLNYPKLHLSQFWNYLSAFIFLDSLQKHLKLLSHFWVAVVPNAIVRQATEEQMGQSIVRQVAMQLLGRQLWGADLFLLCRVPKISCIPAFL